ncbi:MAG: hypothetical protein AABY15_02835 [Nanoarchaeota archaeon]
MIRQLFPLRYIYAVHCNESEQSIRDIQDLCRVGSTSGSTIGDYTCIMRPQEFPGGPIRIELTLSDKSKEIPSYKTHATYVRMDMDQYIVLDFEKEINEMVRTLTADEIKNEYEINMESEISLSEFEKAKQTIINYYGQDFAKIHGSDRPCICCDKKIKPIHAETTRFPQSGMYHGGTVDKISAGYGSNVDGDMFIIALCDECIERLKKESKIQYAGNYMNMY